MRVRVKPNSRKNEIVGVVDGITIVRIKAPADKGKANKELVKFLSKELGKKVEIKSGHKSREKILKIS